MIGTASITMATVGLTAGVQEFSEILFFENQAALDRFKQNKFEFTAGVSAVVLTAGGAKTANYGTASRCSASRRPERWRRFRSAHRSSTSSPNLRPQRNRRAGHALAGLVAAAAAVAGPLHAQAASARDRRFRPGRSA